MELRLRNILMMLVPTTILGFSLFWWKQKKIKGDLPKKEERKYIEVTEFSESVKPKEKIFEESCTVEEQSLEFVGTDTFDDSLTMQDYNHTSKRKREHSSCDGDSAYVEDFSSDCISVSGSDSNSSKTPSTPEHPIIEDFISPVECENVESVAPSNDFRDWFGPALEPTEEDQTFADIIHWGSQPASDLEGDADENNPLKHDLIGGVAIEKLSIVLEKEYEQRKAKGLKSSKTDKTKSSSPRKSPKSPKKPPRSPKKSESSKPQTPKSSSKSQRSRRSSKNKEERDLDKPWREEEAKNMTNEIETDPLPLYPNDYVVFEFQIPEDLCGKIIGKHGKAVKDINEKTGAYVCIENEKIGDECLLSISGLYCQVQEAEKILSTKFKGSLEKVVAEWPENANVESMSMPATQYVNVIVTAIVNAGNLFIQIFGKEVNDNLVQLQNDISVAYDVPPQRVMYHDGKKPSVGEVCIAFIDNIWCRVRVMDNSKDTEIVVVFIDYGGSVVVHWQMLYKSRKEFSVLPAQAIECFLVDSYPLPDQTDYSYSANLTLNQLVEGKVLKSFVHGTDNDVPVVELFYTKEETQEEISVNGNLINWGLVSQYASDPVFVKETLEIVEFKPAETAVEAETSDEPLP